jgi:hypothetical protein
VAGCRLGASKLSSRKKQYKLYTPFLRKQVLTSTTKHAAADAAHTPLTTPTAPTAPVAITPVKARARTAKAVKAAPAKPSQVKKARIAAPADASKANPAIGAKRIAKPVTGTPAPTPAKATKSEKARKPKLVRDSFTIPKAEYQVLETLKQRAIQLAQPAKKSELLRAGIKALAALPDAEFRAALAAVPAIKTGRPAGQTAG